MIPDFLKELRKPSDFYALVNASILLCYAVGIVPFRFTGPTGKRKISFGLLGYFNVLANIVLYSYCFISSILNEETVIGLFLKSQISVFGDLAQKLCAFIGMLSFFCSSFFKKQTLIELIESLANCDIKLKNAGIEVKYQRCINYIYRIYSLTVIFNGIFIVGSLVLLSKYGVTPTLTADVAFWSPCVLISLIVTLYAGMTTSVKYRFELINEILVDFSQSLHSISQNEATLLDSNETVINNPEPYSVFMIRKNPTVVIHQLMEIYSLVFQAGRVANSYFSYQNLTIITMSFLVLVFDAYYILQTLFGSRSGNFDTGDFIAFFAGQMALYLIAIFIIVEGASTATEESEKTGELVHVLINQVTDYETKENLQNFSLQLLHQKTKFSAAGLFNINRTLYFTIAGAITTYLIILLQFATGGNKQNSRRE